MIIKMEKYDLYLEKINAQMEQYSAKLAGIRGKANNPFYLRCVFLNQSNALSNTEALAVTW